MLFTSAIFIFAFAPIAIVVFWLLPQRWRLHWLTIASYYFYAWWDWRFCLIMLFTTIVDYNAGRQMAVAKSRAQARWWLIASLVANLGMLGFFKYAGFAARTVDAIAALFGGNAHVPILDIVLPVGISFYTFQSMTHTIDIYWRRAKPAAYFMHFAAYVSMFPQLVAGPIVRWKHIDQQLLNFPAHLTWDRLSLGLTFFAAGLIKKMLIADRLAYFVDPLWTDYTHLAPGEAWLAMLGYGLQIYFDFAGYSLMAIGLGHLLGVSIPQNFNSPYRASDITDFWRRWHMTLSSWLRDYLFVALGGLHVTKRWVALLGTMLLAGLWHGAAWTFVLWGGFHGAALTIHHALRALKLKWRGRYWGTAGTLLLVMLGWVLFRAPSLHVAGHIYATLFDVRRLAEPCHVPLDFPAMIVVALAWAIFAPNTYQLIHARQARPRIAVQITLGILAALSVLFLSGSSPFLYYQF